MPNFIDISGKKYNKLTVLKRDTTKKGTFWICQCECGNIKTIRGAALKNGNTKSCGYCNNIIKGTREERKQKINNYNSNWRRLYNILINARLRCNCKTHRDYKFYGERGIKVCQEWNDFDNFYNWSINNGYADNLTLDRIDNNKNYSPDNCRWVDRKVQANNTRRNHFLTYNNETLSITQWSEKLKINRRTIYKELNKGLSVEQIFSKY